MPKLAQDFFFFEKLPFELQTQIMHYASHYSYRINRKLELLRKKNQNEVWKYCLQTEFPHYKPLGNDFYAEYLRICKIEYQDYKRRQIELITLIKCGDGPLFQSKLKTLKFGLNEFYSKDKSQYQYTWLYWLLRANQQKLYDIVFNEVVKPFFKDSWHEKDEQGAGLLLWAALCNQTAFLKEKFLTCPIQRLGVFYESGGAGKPWLIQHICDQRNQALLDFIFEQRVVPFFAKHVLDEQGFNLLHWAVRCNQKKEKILELMDQGLNVNSLSTNRNVTPLFLAVQNNHLALVDLLLQHGGDPNLCRADHCSPLFFAAEQGNLAIVKALVCSHKFKTIDPQGGNLLTPVFRAALFDHFEVMDFLLAHGANAQFQDVKSGHTMLFYAIVNKLPNIVRVLLKHHADLDLSFPRLNGDTPLSLAKKTDCTEIADLVLKNELKRRL